MKTQRKRRTKAEMLAVKATQEQNGKIKENLEKGKMTDKELIMAALPKFKEKEFVYVDREVPVIKEVRVLKDNQGTELSITDIVKQELDIVNVWEYKNIPINEFNIGELKKLGKDGWKFAFDLDPSITHAVNVTTLIFQRPVRK